MDADIVISLTHFKGHEAAGIGGTIKNLGMGGGSRAGKKEMHADGKPAVNESKCIGCGACTQDLRPRCTDDREPQDAHRHEQMRRLRPLHRRVPDGCH